MRNTVEEALDVEIEGPIETPAPPTCRRHRVERRSTRPVAVGVRVEPGLHQRLQASPDDLLSHAVRDRRNTERARAAVGLGDVDPADRGRKVAARRQPVPELVEVARQVSLELRNRLTVDPSRTAVRPYPLEGFPDLLLGNIERLHPTHAGPPVTGCRQDGAGRRDPFGPAVSRGLHPYYGSLRPSAPYRYSGPCGGCPLERLPSHRGGRFPRSERAPVSESRRLHAGCHLGSNQGVPQTRPGLTTTSRFRHRLFAFDTSSAVRSRSPLRHSPDGMMSRLFLRRSLRRLLTNAARSGLGPVPDDRPRGAVPHRSISTTPPFVGMFVAHCHRRRSGSSS